MTRSRWTLAEPSEVSSFLSISRFYCSMFAIYRLAHSPLEQIPGPSYRWSAPAWTSVPVAAPSRGGCARRSRGWKWGYGTCRAASCSLESGRFLDSPRGSCRTEGSWSETSENYKSGVGWSSRTGAILFFYLWPLFSLLVSVKVCLGHTLVNWTMNSSWKTSWNPYKSHQSRLFLLMFIMIEADKFKAVCTVFDPPSTSAQKCA